MLQGQNGPNRGLGLEAIQNPKIIQMMELALNMYCFGIGNAQPPYFVSAFLDYILASELPRGYKVPKFLKFVRELEESIVEHVAHFQMECGDLAIDKFLKMKYFPSSLTKICFTWFTILPPNLIYIWAQLERVLHQHFFRGEANVSLIDLEITKDFKSETIGDYLNRFRQMKS